MTGCPLLCHIGENHRVIGKDDEGIVKFTVRRLAAATWHPLPILLWIEWFLLSVNLFNLIEFPRFDVGFQVVFADANLPWIDLPPTETLIVFFLFAGLGFWIPKRQTWKKIIYTAIELGLLNLAALSLGCWDCFSWALIVIVIRSCVIFNLPGRLITAGVSFILLVLIELLTVTLWREEILLDMFDISSLSEPIEIETLSASQLSSLLIQERIEITLFTGLVLVFVLLLTNALASERQGRRQLTTAHEQLRQYALRVETQATVEERNRIAREIHDSLGHLLTAQKIQLNNALAFLPEEPSALTVKPFLLEGKQLGVEALQELRRSLKLLRSDPLQSTSLNQLLQHLIERFQRDTGCEINAQVQQDLAVSNEIKRAVYRIVEEALTNAGKYSNAARITVGVHTHASTRELWLEIIDDGQGFDINQNTSGFGLRGMKERTLALNGHLQIESQPGMGCKISGRLPLGALNYVNVHD